VQPNEVRSTKTASLSRDLRRMLSLMSRLILSLHGHGAANESDVQELKSWLRRVDRSAPVGGSTDAST